MKDFQIDFMGKRLMATALSGLLLLVAMGSLATQGMNLGLDFTGGSLVEVKLAEKVDPQAVRGFLVDAGFTNGTVQTFGSDEDLLIGCRHKPARTLRHRWAWVMRFLCAGRQLCGHCFTAV